MFRGTLEAWAPELVEVGLKRRGGASLCAHPMVSGLRGEPLSCLSTNRTVLAGTARVELCAQGSTDLADLDDGPYEAGGEKDQDPSLIPVPANSYFGRDPSLVQNHSNPLLLSLFLFLHTPILLSLSFCCFASGFLVSLTFFLLFFPFHLLLAFLPVSVSSLCAPFSCWPFPGVSSRPAPPTGLLFVTNIDSSDPDQLVYKTLDPADRLTGPAGDLTLNSYLGL